VLPQAAQSGHCDIIEYLLSKNANPNLLRVFDGLPPIAAAVEEGHLDCLHVLINSGCDVNQISLGVGFVDQADDSFESDDKQVIDMANGRVAVDRELIDTFLSEDDYLDGRTALCVMIRDTRTPGAGCGLGSRIQQTCV